MKNTTKFLLLKPGKEKALSNFHPWLFSGAFKTIPDFTPGDEVIVKDSEGHFLAKGHFCGPQGLVVRVFSFEEEKETAAIIKERLTEAWHLRQRLGFDSTATNGFRLIHGEGDGLSGLVADVFNDTLSITLSHPGFVPWLKEIVDFFTPILGIRSVVVERSYEKTQEIMRGSDEPKEFIENGLTFMADVHHGQKTGHFLDQRNNRLLLQTFAKDQRVLDAFCYSGGFSVYALKGGARSVTSVDISEHAIKATRTHAEKNRPWSGKHEALVKDCFTYLREMEPDSFDMIVLDPPAFAKSAEAVMRASRGYKDINLLAMKSLPKGGLLWTFSCSQHISVDLFKKIIFAAAKDARRSATILYELAQGPDHPVSVFCPQSSYLKGLVVRVA